MARRIALARTLASAALAAAVGLCSTLCFAALQTQSLNGKIVAQKLVDEALAKHPEVTGIELAAPTSKGCSTIASTDPKGVGEKCDQDELGPLRTGKPFVEKETDGFDATLPLHDAAGKIIGTIGMDFKPKPGQTESIIIDQASKIVRELETQVPSKARLFERAD
jgi:hypothetical protein